MTERIAKLNKRFSQTPVEEVLKYFLTEFKGKIAFSTSLGAEDQVLTHMITGIDAGVKIFTLDTGRMFPELYELIDRTCNTYKIEINTYFPGFEQLENMVNE
ncbi:MAG: phosphoadenosine phosphosulfate reductase family protein, partial [Bacteroidota bacterium]|nr:phosphoadenosine phosphosulfate reductase family protein [Bacteroidota bacterium]